MRHQRVTLVIAEGNHDQASSHWLPETFAMFYEHEPRITVVTDPRPRHVVVHGECFLGYDHGYLIKPPAMPGVFAAEFAPQWGQTRHRFVHFGHRHFPMKNGQFPGVILEQHATLAARDAYAARAGYHSARRADVITYHAKFGEVGSAIVTPEMLQ